jgi:hypothetical protein
MEEGESKKKILYEFFNKVAKNHGKGIDDHRKLIKKYLKHSSYMCFNYIEAVCNISCVEDLLNPGRMVENWLLIDRKNKKNYLNFAQSFLVDEAEEGRVGGK